MTKGKKEMTMKKTTKKCADPVLFEDLLNELPPEANAQLADPKLVTYYKAYSERIIYIVKDIDDDLFQETSMILQWNLEDEMAGLAPEERRPIRIMIHSYGGALDAAFAFIDVMNLSKTPIITVNLQCALSSGSLILMNGHRGRRYCLKMSHALIHDGSGGSGGTYDQVQAAAENYKRIIQMMRDNIISHTNVDQKQLNKWKGKEIYLYAEDQIKYGLVDHIVEDINDILKV